MDRRDLGPNVSGYKEELAKENGMEIDLSKEYADINGSKFRMPYRMVKTVTFSNIDKKELIDQEHAARLQYRLMMLDPVIKARVNYLKSQITIIYNPEGADNIRDKISLKGLLEFLGKEGVHVDQKSIAESDFDYVKEMYSYYFNSPRIREHPPYGYTEAEWKEIKPKFEEETKKQKVEKWQKFLDFQKKYKAEHPQILDGV
jgi:hypothetical protein